ncbi:aminotransferase class III-fold pyridoxal phosphate-dependent enzyme [Phaeobacter sp.]|uniref:aminotransferase class III-fold pyridoxal phosphate-dependent enzyme n=1 Tax=Phaeobacter sp. TaxID=1902409 RepID=UPI0025F16B67|nr:aminotransferase class III-fold pyridoxal phosphate-dependent enzyme [Phaeobacter sp.]
MTTTYWQAALQEHWGLQAELTRLDGEYDLNFRAVAADESTYVLKAMHPGCDPALVDMQISALQRIATSAPELPLPRIIPTAGNQHCLTIRDNENNDRIIWLQTGLPGSCYAHSNPKSQSLIFEFGQTLAGVTQALEGFDHPALHRDFKWNLTTADWIAEHIHIVDTPARRSLIEEICSTFNSIKPDLDQLDRQAIHNDANDYNILFSGGLTTEPHISGLIDLGDMCAAPRICDLAIAAAYIVLDQTRPQAALRALVAGYHATTPLSAQEIDMLWPLLRMRLAVSVINSTLMAQDNPDDPYITISQAPAWQFLEQDAEHPTLIAGRLRTACGLPVVDGADDVMAYLQTHAGTFAPLMGQDLADIPMGSLSVENSTWPQNPFDMPLAEAAQVGAEFSGAQGTDWWLGYYNEPRLIYTAGAFRKGPYKASDRRTVHLAVDVFAPSGEALHAPLEGEVLVVENRADHLDYGGVIILKHTTDQGDPFYTLYGHLDPECCDRLNPGDKIEKGAAFCQLGTALQNGGWAPHVHFQIALSTEGIETDWPGVADPDDLGLWNALCPNPAPLLNLPDAKTEYHPTQKAEVLADREAFFGPNLRLTYADPVMLMRGWKHHLFDEWGRPYLDAYNNVPHVGHAHPRIQSVAADQLKRMNSNTRYLHPAQTAFAKKILEKMPGHLEVCFFVNSGSEANELALRLARAHTKAKGMITPDHGYHGNTTGVIDISAYKFNAKGGVGPSDWVELVEVADDYRGRFRRDDPERAEKFAELVDDAIKQLIAKGYGLAGFIAETFPSVGGQIIPPKGYLPAVYERIRAAGGICIADEVQTGLGRLGDYYFGFEHQGATPDIVVLGKPIGNGHPLGVLVTTRDIAASFAEGPEFFSTFGGSNLSCRIGTEVLTIVEDEHLQQNAKERGAELISGLKELQTRYPMLGDVRGMGLFIGVELIEPDGSEATDLCAYLKNRMRDHRILIGSEGPKDNILKIRPPLTIEAEDIQMILDCMDRVLAEIQQSRSH